MACIDTQNREISRREVAAFKSDAPDRYFAYHVGASFPGFPARIGRDITTWMGDCLGYVIWAGNP